MCHSVDRKYCFFDKVVCDDVNAVCVYFPAMDLMSSKVSMNMKMPVMMAIEPRAWIKNWTVILLSDKKKEL